MSKIDAKHYDVIIVGGGHAGAEAAFSAAKMGAKTLLISSSKEAVGGTSCNPAIGGIGKTHIVKEIDVFNGIMPKAADMAAIHYRTLNKKKGKAVQATRVQIDKELYKKAVEDILYPSENLEVVCDCVIDIHLENSKKVTGVKTLITDYYAPSIIITTGTFLGGIIHIGTHKIPAGRFGDKASMGLRNFFIENKFNTKNLKTGTPARLDGRTIEWSQLELQHSEQEADFVSRGTSHFFNPQIACGITFTNKKTHTIIQDNIHLSSVYSGQVGGKGPRYCPSIEDKIFKFPDKDQHQIFVEPEGLHLHSVYPNGISTALPQKIQDAYLRSIQGFENVSILRYGYAIEYMNLDPQELYHNLETRRIKGLFLAGQINGTTGYEEAAGQGLAAGINAVLSIDNKEHIFSRSNSYIGVMIDDLVSEGIDEPYRMFTSRSEFRTLIRSDNAMLRLGNTSLVSSGTTFQSYYYLKEILDHLFLTPAISKKMNCEMPADGKKRSFYQLLSHPDYAGLIKKYIKDNFSPFNDAIDTLITDGEYHTYTNRLFKFQQDIKNMQDINIPQGFNFKKIQGIAKEISERLNHQKPRSVYEVKKINGITPAAFMIISRFFMQKKISA